MQAGAAALQRASGCGGRSSQGGHSPARLSAASSWAGDGGVMAGCQCCMRSGRWSACSRATCRLAGPSRADRRSMSWCQGSPRALSGAGGSRLALAWARARRLQAAQRQAVHRRGQALVRQALGQQAAQVGHGLQRLGDAQLQALPGRQVHAIDAAQVMAPGQLQRQHTLLARTQPALQRIQQALAGPSAARGPIRPAPAAPAPAQTVRAG